MEPPFPPSDPTELRHRIRLLQTMLAAAEDAGTAAYEPYKCRLEEELSRCREAFVEAAVLQIAVSRATVSGPLLG